jgi:hypothetical protein
MRVSWVVPLALFVLPSAVTADIYVKAQNQRITVRAQREPLSRVLAGIARETGISVVNPSSAPSQLVTISLDNVTPQEALIRLFDGQGLNYIFQLDPTGSRVAVLVLAGSAPGGGRSVGAGPTHAQPVAAPQMYEEEQPPEDEPEPEEEVIEPTVNEEAAQPQVQEGGNISNSVWNPPGAVVMPQPGGAFPGAIQGQPGIQQPGFPGGASGVTIQPPQPSVPRFPGGISQPQPQPQ